MKQKPIMTMVKTDDIMRTITMTLSDSDKMATAVMVVSHADRITR